MDSMADPVASVHQEYASTHARLHRSKQLVRNINTAHWVYRLAYNAEAEAERSFSRYRARQLDLGRDLPHRPTSFEHDVALKSLRVHDKGGPAFEEAVSFPVTMLRAATREVHDATTATIKRWAKGQRSSMPRFRSARDSQTIKLSAFSIRRMDSHESGFGTNP
jgi:hypothetical protein